MVKSPKDGKALARLFSASGHVVEQIPNGLDAFEKVCENLDAFDVIVMDHLIPGATGPLLVELLWQAKYSGRIVVRSAKLTRKEAEGYRRFGAAAMISRNDRDAVILNAATKK